MTETPFSENKQNWTNKMFSSKPRQVCIPPVASTLTLLLCAQLYALSRTMEGLSLLKTRILYYLGVFFFFARWVQQTMQNDKQKLSIWERAAKHVDPKELMHQRHVT